jgi:hypothetical protein
MPIEVKVFTPSGDTTVVIWDSLDVQHFWITLSDRPDSLIWDPENWVLEQHTITYDPALNVGEYAEGRTRDITVKVEGRRVEVMAPLGKGKVAVYDRAGRLVAEGKVRLLTRLRAGVYYAVSGSRVRAFVVR